MFWGRKDLVGGVVVNVVVVAEVVVGQ